MRTSTCTRWSLSGDQLVEGGPDVCLRQLLLVRTVVAEQDDPQPALLVAEQSLPGPVAVDANGLRSENRLDRRRVAAGEAQGGQQAERDRPAVRELIAGCRLEGVAERVAEVERAAAPGRADRAGRERT